MKAAQIKPPVTVCWSARVCIW